MDGEIYPVFANYASLRKQDERSFAVVAVTITNLTDEKVSQRLTVQVPGWSDREVQAAEIDPGKARTLLFAPSFLPRFYANREIIAATVRISATDLQGRTVYESTLPVRLRSSEDMYWGADFKYASFIASWVTPHDPQIEATLAKAKRYTADHRLPGYEGWKDTRGQELETYREARAIFTALQNSGLSYVKSSGTLGDHQALSERVRMPHASLLHSSANCIDAAVAYASLFENLGMDAEVILVPGHAYVGVRVARAADKFLIIDAALTGRSTFSAAVASAQRGLSRLAPASIKPILVSQARLAGIYPMPR
ncbi:MAG TPA: hypothetical protein VKW06_19270 [Candidatus Angelobacter sp.]|nr:hypothetical protein [Candidatus Angelobacter sp.]